MRDLLVAIFLMIAFPFAGIAAADGRADAPARAEAGPARKVSAILRELDEAASLRWCGAKAGLPRLVVEGAQREAALIDELAGSGGAAGELSAAAALQAAGLLAGAGRYAHALSVLDAAGADTVAGDPRFLRALCLDGLGRCAEAAEAYGSYSSSGGLLGDYALFFAARCMGSRGGPAAALDPLRRLVAKWKHSPLWAESALVLCECYLKLGRFEDCIELASAISAQAPSGVDRLTASYHMARALESAGRAEEALGQYWGIVRDHPSHPKAGRAFRAFAKLERSRGSALSPREKYLGGVALSRTGNLGEAYGLLEKLASGAEGGPYWEEALEEMARISYRRRRYSDAARHYETLARAGRMDADEAMLWVGRSLIRSGSYERAFEILEGIGNGSARAGVRAEALWEVAREKESLNRIDEAAEIYRFVTENLASAPLGPAACWRWGFCLYLLEDWEGALGAFQRACDLARAPHRSAQALYWKAKILARLGRGRDAGECLKMAAAYGPAVYYGSRAAWVLATLEAGEVGVGLSVGDSTSVRSEPDSDDGAPAPDVLEGTAPCADAERGHPGHGSLPYETEPAIDPAAWHFSRGMRLLMWGQRQRGARELRMAAASGYRAERVQDTLLHFGEYRQAMQLEGDAPPPHVSSPGEGGCYIKFPLAFAGPVWTRSGEAGVDPLLTLAVMRQESRFDRNAVSSAGAYGLMQLMPSTAKRLARKGGIRWRGSGQLLDPEANIELGTTELKGLFEEFGTLPGVLAGYNAGRARAHRWSEAARDGDFDAYIEAIGYRQTRDYVKLVLRDYLLYLRLYDHSWGPH